MRMWPARMSVLRVSNADYHTYLPMPHPSSNDAYWYV